MNETDGNRLGTPEREDWIFAIIIGERKSKLEAENYACRIRNCPHIIFQSVCARFVISGCVVPADKKWWLKYPEVKPKYLGFKWARVYDWQRIISPENFQPLLPSVKAEIAPCGADCRTCPIREENRCPCCPATVWFKNKGTDNP